MPNHLYALIVATLALLFFSVPASADDVTVTFDAPEQFLFDTLCEELRLTRTNPDDPWGNKRCLKRFAKKGMRNFKRNTSGTQRMIDSKFQHQQDMIDFNLVFPEEQ